MWKVEVGRKISTRHDSIVVLDFVRVGRPDGERVEMHLVVIVLGTKHEQQYNYRWN